MAAFEFALVPTGVQASLLPIGIVNLGKRGGSSWQSWVQCKLFDVSVPSAFVGVLFSGDDIGTHWNATVLPYDGEGVDRGKGLAEHTFL